MTRRPGQRARRVVAPPTGAPGDPAQAPPAPEAAAVAGAPGASFPAAGGPSPARDRVWEAEAERLRSERPPHWG